MTPPKITGQSEGIYNQAAGLCEVPEQVSKAPEAGPVCSAQNYLSPVRLLKIDLNARFASLQRNHLLMGASGTSGASVIAALASKGSSAPSKAPFNPVAASPITVGFGCSNSEEIREAPADEPTKIPTENPAPIPGEHDGVGSVNSSFATSQCANPASLFKSYSDNSLLMVCGDAVAPGASLIESVDPTSGAVTSISIPNTVPDLVTGGEPKPVALSAGATHEGTKLVFAGLTPLGTDSEFASNPFIYRNSGIYTVNAAGQNPKLTTFKTLIELRVDGVAQNIPLVNPEDGTNAGAIVSLNPNTPVSMVVDGDTLYSLNMNLQNDQNGNFAQMLGPASIHAFTISQDGLAHKPFGSRHLQADADISDGHAVILDGNYMPAAIASVGDGRLAVLIRGLQGDSASKIILLEIEDPTVQTSIPLGDTAGSMWAGDSNQLPIVKINNVTYALVGAGDQSGRVAMVNLDTHDVKLVGVFGEGHNVVSVVVDEASSQALAVSDQGQVISLNLKEIDAATGLPTVGVPHPLPADARVAAVRGNSLVVAHPNNYSQVSITAAPAN